MDWWKTRPLADRFEEKYERIPWSGCWIWLSSTSGDDRPVIFRDGKRPRAYRIAYELYRGPIPAGMDVCHHCDIPLCVNPDHLFLGKDADNLGDMVRKGRQARGEKQGLSKITAEAVKDMRASSETLSVLAKRHGCSVSTVSLVRLRRIWRHVP